MRPGQSVQQRLQVAKNSHYKGPTNLPHLKMEVWRNFLLDCKTFKRFMNDPERRGDTQECDNKLLSNLVGGHLSVFVLYQLPPIKSLKTKIKSQHIQIQQIIIMNESELN